MDPPVNNDDFVELGAAPVQQVVGPGRAKGMPNFRADEDEMLATAYVFVTTNAAVGTDQNGATFWEKIRVIFVQRGGNRGRTTGSLQNRFNKTLQMEVNKYIGMLTSSLREYHTGWALEDYVHDAKRKFITNFDKPFKHETVYNTLKRSLTKFAIDMDSVHPRVKRAIFFCDNNNAWAVADGNVDGGVAGDGVVAHAAGGGIPGIGMYTPHPTVGKKKAKALLMSNSVTSGNKKQKAEEAALANENIIAMRTNSLAILVEEIQKKNRLAEQQFAYQFFTSRPDSVESKAFFEAMAKKFAGYGVAPEVAVVESVESVESSLISAPRDDDTDDGVEMYNSRGLFVSGGFSRDLVLDNVVAQCAPAIDMDEILRNMTGSDFTQDSLPPLRSTQKLVAALHDHRNENIQDVDDSQQTTLN